MNATDLDLLRQFAGDHSQDAFTALVNRHVNLVYSAALRQVRSPHLAEEVAQSVFADLAREAAQLKPDTILPAWLYQVARRTAVDVIRRDSRRQMREQIACEMNAMNTPEAGWTHIEPLLDEAMAALEETDRAAVLLRYFENKSLREVGLALGVSDDAAQKRVSRALERLREHFAERKVTVGAGAVAVLISAHAVAAAPAGLALAISAATILTVAGTAATTATTTTAITAAKTIIMTTMQKAIVTAVLALAAGTGIYEAHQAAMAQRNWAAQQQAQADWTDQIRQLQATRNEAANRLAALAAENGRLRSNNVELLKLRGEVTQLRKAAQELAAMKTILPAVTNEANPPEAAWLDRVRRFKEWVEKTPGAKIPEMQYLTDQDWLTATEGKLENEPDYRQALTSLQSNAQGEILRLMETALRKYLDANQGKFPADLTKLAPYYENYPGDELVQRYQIVPAGQVPQLNSAGNSGEWNITPRYAVGDGRWALDANGVSGYSQKYAAAMQVLAPAMQALYANTPMINGRKQIDPHQLPPYLTTPEEKAAYEKLINHQAP